MAGAETGLESGLQGPSSLHVAAIPAFSFLFFSLGVPCLMGDAAPSAIPPLSAAHYSQSVSQSLGPCRLSHAPQGLQLSRGQATTNTYICPVLGRYDALSPVR